MAKSLSPAFVDLLESSSLSDVEIRRLVGWQALFLIDLLQRKCITIRYAEQSLFNLDVIRQLEKRGLADCVELIDWGMQLEDWDEYTPDDLPEALTKVAQLAQRLLTMNITSTPPPTSSALQ